MSQVDYFNSQKTRTSISIYQISGQQFWRVVIGSRNTEYPWLSAKDHESLHEYASLHREYGILLSVSVLGRDSKLRLVSLQLQAILFYPTDLVNTLSVGEQLQISTSTSGNNCFNMYYFIYHVLKSIFPELFVDQLLRLSYVLFRKMARRKLLYPGQR